jgi:hypothetical protein
MSARRRGGLATLLLAFSLAACADAETAAPTCDRSQRVAIVAQSVPTASFVPCIAELPAGWSVRTFAARRSGTDLVLRSDRAHDDVEVRFRRTCDVRSATPMAPRDDGVRTYVELDAVSPDYAGRMLDVFPGGCVTYEFAFERGPHITLVDDLRVAVGLQARRELRRELREDIGADLDP